VQTKLYDIQSKSKTVRFLGSAKIKLKKKLKKTFPKCERSEITHKFQTLVFKTIMKSCKTRRLSRSYSKIPHFPTRRKSIFVPRESSLFINSKVCRNQQNLLTGSWVKVKVRVSSSFIVVPLANTNLLVSSENKTPNLLRL